MSNDDKPVTVKQFNNFIVTLVEHLNKVHSQTCSRLDKIDDRLGRMDDRLINLENGLGKIESNITSVKRDTAILPDIFEILHTDGEYISQLTTRINKLEN